MNGLVLEMGKLVCSVCGYSYWLFIRSQEEFNNIKCSKCSSTIWQMEQYELDEQYIDWIRSQQI